MRPESPACAQRAEEGIEMSLLSYTDVNGLQKQPLIIQGSIHEWKSTKEETIPEPQRARLRLLYATAALASVLLHLHMRSLVRKKKPLTTECCE